MKVSQLACTDGHVRVHERQHQPSLVLFVPLRQMLHSSWSVHKAGRILSLNQERVSFERHNFLYEEE
jgi:hypothetical protein